MSSFYVSATVKYTVPIKRICSGTRLYRSQQEVFNELKLQSSWFRDKPNCGFKVNELRNCEFERRFVVVLTEDIVLANFSVLQSIEEQLVVSAFEGGFDMEKKNNFYKSKVPDDCNGFMKEDDSGCWEYWIRNIEGKCNIIRGPEKFTSENLNDD